MRIKLLGLVILAVIFLLVFTNSSFALLRGFAPDDYPGDKTYGIGLYFAPKDLKLYEKPDYNSEVKEMINWAYARVQVNSASGIIDDPNDVFVAFYPYKDIAIMSVVDDTDEWIKVIYDHKSQLSGWLNLKDHKASSKYNNYIGNFYPWLKFMQIFAKKQFLYFIPGVPKEYKSLRAAPSDDAKAVAHEFTHIRSIQFRHLRGNWLLVKVQDFSEGSPIGWLRWRDDNGKLMIFCNFD